MVEENSRFTVKFSVSGLPDTAGLRIRSTDPTGLYISSRDAQAAQWHFETKIVEFVSRLGLLVPKQKVCLHLEESIDWNFVTISGVGEVNICALSVKKTQDIVRTASLVRFSPVQELAIEWLKNSDGNKVCFIRDPGDYIDRWIIDSFMEDKIKTTIH